MNPIFVFVQKNHAEKIVVVHYQFSKKTKYRFRQKSIQKIIKKNFSKKVKPFIQI